MPRAGLDTKAVIAAGAALADEVGLAGLTMGLLADRLGVRPPSLYKHVGSLHELRHGISVQAKGEFAHQLARESVGRSGPDAVRTFADSYRHWALEHPGRYAATVPVPAAGDEEDRRVSEEALQVLLDVLAGFGLAEARVVDSARAMRSALHGFVTLEGAGGFGMPRDVTRSFHFLIDTLIAGFQADLTDHTSEG
ncbi:TetR/AcrR family transcriptional regulator [Streptomyces fulvorobeus]|uniref:AcrR family transcriptional regulator n=1 Tax=Streptomyces fulvorobeus TaxID=284028 RepID=A0A7J0BYK5_9ACTN|nr:TetR/AcrR family transcriptional regulator [Streptomyces fulvorobeus]NYE39101.1 AcrR family transcriptional regulator [Streptomyces fulvorobeus]GFM95301.1 TetR family transcriptional regulator [Streptomyces fulvorobeus]